MRAYALKDKTVLRFTKDAAAFLNAYTTNTPDAPWNAFVDIRGHVVAVFAQKKLSENEVIAVLGKAFVGRVLGHLEKYLRITGTAAEEETSWHVYHCLDETPFEETPGIVRIPLEKEEGEILLSSEPIPADVSDAVYTLYRVRHGIAEQGTDFDDELLLNVDADGRRYASFTKGCYLGQEIIARVHYRSRPPKRLVVRDEATLDAEARGRMTSKVKDASDGNIKGFIVENTL